MVLAGRETDPTKIFLAMLIIIYRLRSNLFHGEKSVYELPGQVENFRMANQVLMTFLDRYRG